MGYLYLSAAHKSSGKTTVSLGLGAALRQRRDLEVQPFKKGPDYIDPLWLGAAAGRSCHNLDFFIQTAEEIRGEFARRMRGADIGLIEGNKGLFDGVALDGSNSNAALAALLEAPVVLVIDSRGMTRGIAPLLLGYQQFTPRVRIAGVILNRVGGARHENKLRQAVEHYTDIPVLGAVPDSPGLEIVERHLGLMPSNEHSETAAIIDRIAAVVGESVDLDALMAAAASAPPVSATGGRPLPEPGDRVRIGVARDAAFGFYYDADLEFLEAAGAQLQFFDTLADTRLPPVDGLFLGGGFPEARMDAIERNADMREQIRDFIEGGGAAYAECGGLMYLCRSLTWNGKVCKMAGVIPADAVMYERPQGRGYVRLRETPQHPWPDGITMEQDDIPAHEFHYSRLENVDRPLTFAYEMARGQGIDGQHDGIVHRNLLASYAHLRDVAGNQWTRRFVAHVRACRQQRRSSQRAKDER
jgi:cobyrinic acid a,c-diamide synthase